MSDDEPVGYDGFGAPIYDHQEDTMPTDLPPDFHGTGKPRSTPNPKIPVEVNIPTPPDDEDDNDAPAWAKALMLAILILGSWVLVDAIFWVVANLIKFVTHLRY